MNPVQRRSKSSLSMSAPPDPCAGPSEMKDRAAPLSEGDVNISPSRAAWRESSSERARDALDEDERYFLRQSLSTPCLTQIVRAEGAALIDIDGRRIFDFHGTSVHQLGHGHPKVVAAIRREMETLPDRKSTRLNSS